MATTKGKLHVTITDRNALIKSRMKLLEHLLWSSLPDCNVKCVISMDACLMVATVPKMRVVAVACSLERLLQCPVDILADCVLDSMVFP